MKHLEMFVILSSCLFVIISLAVGLDLTTGLVLTEIILLALTFLATIGISILKLKK